jgi:hypothetical protein
MSWRCSTCGETHEDVPLSFAAGFPDNYANLTADAREERCLISSDQCVIDENQYYIRGCLEIPIQGTDEIFLWGVWALLSAEDFLEISECWEETGREDTHGPFKGRLGNALQQYYKPDAFNLKLTLKLRPVGNRPLFLVEERDHPLAVAQKQGMSRDEVNALVSLLMH